MRRRLETITAVLAYVLMVFAVLIAVVGVWVVVADDAAHSRAHRCAYILEEREH